MNKVLSEKTKNYFIEYAKNQAQELVPFFIDDFHKRRNVKFTIPESVIGAAKDTGNYLLCKLNSEEPIIMKQVFVSDNDRPTFF